MKCVIECGGEVREFGINLSADNVARCSEIAAKAAADGDERLDLVRILLGDEAAEWVASLSYGEVAMLYAELAAQVQTRRMVELAAIAKEYADAV